MHECEPRENHFLLVRTHGSLSNSPRFLGNIEVATLSLEDCILFPPSNDLHSGRLRIKLTTFHMNVVPRSTKNTNGETEN